MATAALLAAPAGASPGAVSRHRSASQRLNFVFILSDDERTQGNAVMHDVNRLLAKHGVTFSNFDVTTSECGPSRASILTGQYSHHTGVMDNFGPHGYPAFAGTSDLANWLHRAGYETALVGKYLNDYSLDGHNAIPPGWDDWQAMDSVPLEKYYDYKVNENGKIVHYGSRPADYSTTVLTKQALAFLRSARRPFFLYFAPVAPHLPAIPAPQDIGKLDSLPTFRTPAVNQLNISSEPWASYHSRSLSEGGIAYTQDVRRHQLESLLSLDRSVKQIVDTLAKRHELRRTVIVYTSDNGFLWGEHRLGGKLWPYRASTHVPLIVRTPWTTANGTFNNEPVLNIDFASTIAELAGIEPGNPAGRRELRADAARQDDPVAEGLHRRVPRQEQAPVGRPAAVRRDPDAPLPLRPVPLPRLAGALRPPPRSVGAPQRGRRQYLRTGPAPAATLAAPHVRRAASP